MYDAGGRAARPFDAERAADLGSPRVAVCGGEGRSSRRASSTSTRRPPTSHVWARVGARATAPRSGASLREPCRSSSSTASPETTCPAPPVWRPTSSSRPGSAPSSRRARAARSKSPSTARSSSPSSRKIGSPSTARSCRSFRVGSATHTSSGPLGQARPARASTLGASVRARCRIASSSTSVSSRSLRRTTPSSTTWRTSLVRHA